MRVHLLLVAGLLWWASAALAQSDSVPPEHGAAGVDAQEADTAIQRVQQAEKNLGKAPERLSIPVDRNAGEPGHAGNETDMVHHRRGQRDKPGD